jgi:hypothetical protein
MDQQIDIAIKRARGYWFVDGFTEIAMGGLLILVAGFLLINMKASQVSFLSWFLSVTGEITILKIVSLLVVVFLLWWLKDHFTYPRTGFVRGKLTANQLRIFVRNVVLFLLVPIGALLIISTFIASTGAVLLTMPIWFPIGLALLWAILIVLAGEWMGLLRFRWIAGMILLAGIAVGIWQSTLGLPNLQSKLLQPTLFESVTRTLMSLSLVLLMSGIILTFSGGLTFMRYRQENPEPYTEDV